jgi:hypothetical protein
MLKDAKNGLVFASEREASINATLTLLYEKTIDAQGQAAREAGTYAGVMGALTAKFEDMSAEIGMALLPILTQFSTWLQTPEGEAKLQAIVDGIVEIITQFIAAVVWVDENKDWLVPMVIAIGAVTTAWKLATAAVNAFKLASGISIIGAAGASGLTVLGAAGAGAALGGFMEGQVVGQTADIYSGGTRYEEGKGLFGDAFKPTTTKTPPANNITINTYNSNITAQEIADKLRRADKNFGGLLWRPGG